MAAPQRSFASGVSATVDYEAGAGEPLLPMPEPTDDLETIVRKIESLAKVVEHGASLAVRTGFVKAAQKGHDPVALSTVSMTPPELFQYKAWDSGAAMPVIDWATCRRPVLGGAASLKRFTRRAGAMRIIWDNENADAENASWLTSEMAYVLPLVSAVAKVSAARRVLSDGQAGLSDLEVVEMVEMKTAHRAVSIAMKNLNQAYQRLSVLSRSTKSSMEIIQARENAIEDRMASQALCSYKASI